MKFRKIIHVSFLLVLSLFLVTSVHAQDVGTASVDSESVQADTSQDNVDQNSSLPSNFGLFWRNLRERVNLVFTLDPVKKAEKQLRFAEERMVIAEQIIENSDDTARQERAQRMIERAQELVTQIGEKKDVLLERRNDRTEQLLENVATHEIRKEEILDKIEAQIPEETREQWDQIRVNATSESRRLMNAINNEQISQPVREHLQNVQSRIEERAEVLNQYMKEKKELFNAVGNEDRTQKALEQLREDQKQALERNREMYKESMYRLKNRVTNVVEGQNVQID